MEKTVTTIPATISKFTAVPIGSERKRRVAGYARVSTDHEEQATSYAAQVDYYTSYIKGHDDWEFVSIYTDSGISATNTKKREGFKRMIADALAGKIDLIITKSVSRFARNTVDSLSTIRKLKEHNVECYFEKENIWTFDGKGELLITIMSSLAQEESRSISENCTWGQRKRFADGKVSVPFSHFLGYDRGEDGNLVINKEQAAVVKRIYDMFLQGMTYNAIANQLSDDGVLTPCGKSKWNVGTVKSILKNEKYAGNALLQKTFCVDFLSKKYKVNDGEVPQYFVENNHDAVVSPEIFDLAQREIARRGHGKKYRSSLHLFSGRVKCGECGGWYGSKIWHSNSKYRKIVWQCNHKFDGDRRCQTPHLTEEEIQQAFTSAANKLLSCKENVITDAKSMVEMLLDTSELEKEQKDILAEMQIISELMKQAVAENARVPLDQSEYRKREAGFVERMETAKKRLDTVQEEIRQKTAQRADVDDFIKAFAEMPCQTTEFSVETWNKLADFITVYGKDDIRVTFRNGQEIKA